MMRGVGPVLRTVLAVAVLAASVADRAASAGAERSGQPAGGAASAAPGMRADPVLPRAEPDGPAADAARRRATDAILDAIADPRGPGLALGVYHRGALVYARGAGLADLETGVPIGPRTVFHVASVSKQFTAFAVALLAREGRLDLDADVRTYLPSVPDFGRRITVRDLVQHTSGLRDQWMLFTLAGFDTSNVLRQAHIMRMVERQRALNFEPGTRYAYSNTGYTLLAEIVRAVAGVTLREFADERIFRPLGMTRTFFNDDVTEVVPGRAHSYQMRGDRWKRALLNFDNVGATSLFTTVEDLARWAGNFGDPKVGDAALIEQIGTPGRLRDGTPVNYGFALHRSRFAGHDALMHYGTDAGYRAGFVYFPAEDFAVLLAANRPLPDQQRTIERVVDLYLNQGAGRLAEPAPEIQPEPALLAAAAGRYVSRHGRMVTLVPREGRLFYRTLFSDMPLLFRADATFEIAPRNWTYYRQFRLRRDPDGAVTGFEVTEPLMGSVEAYSRAAPATPGAAELQALAGDYRSPELDVTYSLAVERGRLVGHAIRIVDPMVFTPSTRDRFDTLMGVIEFVRDGAGRAVAFKLHSTGVNDVLFERLG